MPLHAIFDLIIGASWLVFVVFWFVAARGAKPDVRRSRVNWAFRIVVVGIAIFVRLHFRGTPHPLRHVPGPAFGAVGTGLCVLGVALAIWARVYLGRNWGMPMTVKKEPELVTTGPYRLVRHPIYSGLLLAMVGSALAPNPLGFVLVAGIGGFFVYSAIEEQKIMGREFPDAYPAYRARTKMLIPFVF